MLMIAGDSPVPVTNYETATALLQPYFPKYLLTPEVAVLLHYLPDERQHMLFATLWNTGGRITDALRHMISARKNSLPLQVQQCVGDLLEHVALIEANIAEYDRILSPIDKTDNSSQWLMELKGVGPPTACALVSCIGNAHDFKNGHQLAAWLGLTPSHYSSGGKSKLGRITKAGDLYLRTLMVQSARSVLIGAEKRTDSSVVGSTHWLNAEDTGALS